MPKRSPIQLLRDESGQAMTEYVIVAILVALVVMFAMGRFQSALSRKFGCGSARASEFDVRDARFVDNRGLPVENCTGFESNVRGGASVGAD